MDGNLLLWHETFVKEVVVSSVIVHASEPSGAVWNEEKGTLALFLLNRGREALETTLALPGFESLKATGHTVLTHPDLQAVNTLDRPGTVLPQARVCDASMLENGRGTVRLEPLSWNVLTFA